MFYLCVKTEGACGVNEVLALMLVGQTPVPENYGVFQQGRLGHKKIDSTHLNETADCRRKLVRDVTMTCCEPYPETGGHKVCSHAAADLKKCSDFTTGKQRLCLRKTRYA